jgi:hypothetical protein
VYLAHAFLAILAVEAISEINNSRVSGAPRSRPSLTFSMLAHYLGRNRLYVFPNHLEITGFEVAKVSANNEHVARVTEREVHFVLETHS